jgi:hypothetical protein
MIVKGHSSTGRGLGAYLLGSKNDRAEVWGIRGDIPRDLKETLEDWRSDALGTQCQKPLYHAQLNPDRALSRDEWDTAIALFEKAMGFEDQPRAIVLHDYKGREHLHLVYSRLDEEGRAISDSWNYVHHEKAARDIEKALGLEKTPGVFIDRDGARAARTPDRDALQQGERTRIDPRAVKAEVSALYRNAGSGPAFAAALEANGYALARGDQRGYVIVDAAGGVHSLSRAADVKAGDLRERLQDLPPESLPSVDEARDAQRERQAETGLEREAAPVLRTPDIDVPQIEAPDIAVPEVGDATAALAETRDDGRDLTGIAASGLKTAGKALGGAASIAEGLIGMLGGDAPATPPKNPEQQGKTEALDAEREARIAANAERQRRDIEAYLKRQKEQDIEFGPWEGGRSLDRDKDRK